VGIDPAALAAILAMAAATYATRAGGLWLAGRLRLSDRAAAWMQSLPGALLVAIVAPTVVAAGPAAGSFHVPPIEWPTSSLAPHHALRPVRAMPRMNCFWAMKKAMMIGASTSTELAISR
jgi:Branched-chain amino acid transport protein (AzlD)